MSDAKTRLWMKIKTQIAGTPDDLIGTQVQLSDIPMLAKLMHRAYKGTIDDEGETPEQCEEELRGTLTGKYVPWIAQHRL